MARLKHMGVDRQTIMLARQLMRLDGLLPNHELFGVSHLDFSKAVGDMSPQSRRKAVRRFRKAWRTALQKAGTPLSRAPAYSHKDKRDMVRNFYLKKAQNLLRKAVWTKWTKR